MMKIYNVGPAGRFKASRRTRFSRVEECITVYSKPCGCEGHPRYLPHGSFAYCYEWSGTLWDLLECRQCGAVWALADAPEFEWWMWAEALAEP